MVSFSIKEKPLYLPKNERRVQREGGVQRPALFQNGKERPVKKHPPLDGLPLNMEDLYQGDCVEETSTPKEEKKKPTTYEFVDLKRKPTGESVPRGRGKKNF